MFAFKNIKLGFLNKNRIVVITREVQIVKRSQFIKDFDKKDIMVEMASKSLTIYELSKKYFNMICIIV